MIVNLNSPVNCQTSYGLTGINLIQSLSKSGHKVRSFPIGGVSYYPHQESVLKALKNGEEAYHYEELITGQKESMGKEKSVRLYHQFGLFEHVCDYHIGFPIFELDDFSPLEKASLTWCDEIFVCSEWAKGVIENRIPHTPKVIPLGVDSSIFFPSEPVSTDDGKDKPFTFFFPGKFEYRKGFDLCMSVFDKAFPKEDVQVLFLPQNLFIPDNEDWARSLMSSALGKRGRVKIFGRMETTEQVADLIRYSDAVVSFSRAEGWNLPLLEALSCGRQVLATNYSGHTEFLTYQNSILLDVYGRESAIDGVFFNGTGNWLEFNDSNIDDFVSALRSIYSVGRKYNLEGVKTAEQFSWENSAKRLVEALS